MLQLAVAGHPAFRIDELESERSGPSYTVDTLEELARRHPGNDWHLVVGSDTLAELGTWHDPVGIVRRAGLVVTTRPGVPIAPPDEVRRSLGLPPDVPLRLQAVETPLVDISSSDIRRRAAAGRSVRYLVPRAVECYLQEKHLYTPPGA
jgi:nicotinate-nucleotide adenylyltransferase